MMMDFLALGDKDPYLFVQKKKSYFAFRQYADTYESTMSALHIKLLEFVSLEIANGRRLEEIALLQCLLENSQVDIYAFVKHMQHTYNITTSVATMRSVVDVLSMQFFKDADIKKYGNMSLVNEAGDIISISDKFAELLQNAEFKTYLQDTLAYAEKRFLADFNAEKFYHGFKLYSSYTRKDACRILNWQKDESSTVYGYRIKYSTCPMFVTYNKSDDISDSTKYEDRFVSPYMFNWMTRSRVDITSPEVDAIKQKSTVKLLFVKKSDDEGSEFYFMGEVTVKPEQCIGTTITGKNGEKLSIVQVFYDMKQPVEPKIYNYFEGK